VKMRGVLFAARRPYASPSLVNLVQGLAALERVFSSYARNVVTKPCPDRSSSDSRHVSSLNAGNRVSGSSALATIGAIVTIKSRPSWRVGVW